MYSTVKFISEIQSCWSISQFLPNSTEEIKENLVLLLVQISRLPLETVLIFRPVIPH